jgi:hypothetical protein
MKQKLVFALIACFLVIIFNSNVAKGQYQGTWAIGWSIGFTTKGGGFIKYYITDGLSVEVFAGVLPHIYHFGGELSFHPLMLGSADFRNFALTAGYSIFGSGGHNFAYSGKGLNFGADLLCTTKQSEFFSKDGYRENFFISLGGTYKTRTRQYIRDSDHENTININKDRHKWQPFFESGVKYFQSK